MARVSKGFENPICYSAGFVLSTGLLHVAGIALGLMRAVPLGARALRAGSGAITLCGSWFLLKAATG